MGLHLGLAILFMPMPPMSSDLISERFVAVYPSLACKLGLNQAIVVQKLHWLLTDVKGGKVIDGEKWIFNTYEQWQQDHFPWWSIRTLKSIFALLESMVVVESCQPDGAMSRKKYYRLNNGMWVKLMAGTLPFLEENTHRAKVARSRVQRLHVPKQNQLNRKSEVSKETSSKEDEFSPVWKPDRRNKTEKLKAIKPPEDFPSEFEFENWHKIMELTNAYRPEIYRTLCLEKWHQWRADLGKWVRIRDWRSYLLGLENKIKASQEAKFGH